MSRLDDWRYLLGRTRALPATIGRELQTLHALAAAVPAVERRVGALDDTIAALAAAVRGLEAAAAGDEVARTVEKRAIDELAARTAELERALASLGTELSAVRSGPLVTLAETLTAFAADAREQALLLDAEVREPMRAAAETALRARLAMLDAAGAGVGIAGSSIAAAGNDGVSIAGAGNAGVSFLIRCRNRARALPGLLASACASLDALGVAGEIVVSDDAGRDDGRAVAERLAASDARIRVVAHDVELGVARTRNVQLALARFRHALVLDADDTLVPAGVVALHAALVETGAALAYGPTLVVDDAERERAVAWGEPAATPWTSAVGPLTMIDVARVRALGGFDPGAPGLEDVELLLRLAAHGSTLTFVPTCVGSRRAPAADVPRAQRERRLRDAYGEREVSAQTHHAALATPVAPVAARGPRILVVSSGGVRNHGDDAILRATLERLARLRPGCVPVVVTDGDALPPLGRLGVWAGTTAELGRALDPAVLRAACVDAVLAETLVTRSEAAGQVIDPALRDLGAYDLVLIAGGGNLADPWPELVAWRTATAVAARARGVPVIVSGQGVGPVSDGLLPMLALLVRSATAFALRDAGSHALLAEHGLAGGTTIVGDDALGLAVDAAAARARLEARGLGAGTPLVGFQARVAGYVGCSRATLLELARSVDGLAAARGAVVLGVPMNAQPPQPEAALQLELRDALGRRRARWMLADAADDAVAAAAAVKTCAALVTCSFHAAVFALEAGIPTALVASTEYYARKAEALRQAFGLPASIAVPPDASPDLLATTLDALGARPWLPAMSSAAVDAWLDAQLG